MQLSPRVRLARCLVAGAALAAGSVGGCSDNDANGRITGKELRRAVLLPADVPRGFMQFDFGKPGFGESTSTLRSDDTRFDREGGWKARYRRPGSARTRGPLIIESRLDVFREAGGAEDDFEAYEREFRDVAAQRATAEEVTVARVGDATVALTLRQRALGGGVRYYRIAWRHANATASITVSGFERRVTLKDAVVLARKQQRRMARAAAS